MIVNSKVKKTYLGRLIILLLGLAIIGCIIYYYFIINKKPTQGEFVYSDLSKEVAVDGYLYQSP